MEIILELFAEKYSVRVEWRQMARAMVLAVLLAGLCNYVSVYNGELKGRMKERTASVESYGHFEDLTDLLALTKGIYEEDKNGIYPEIRLINSDNTIYHNIRAGNFESPKERSSTEEKEENDKRQEDILSVPQAGKETNISLPNEVLDSTTKIPEEPKEESGNNAALDDTISSIPAVISISLYGNGGVPEVITDSCSPDEFAIGNYETPKRMGKLFDGWFCDKECTIPFMAVLADQTSLKLYAGWKEFPGFISNDNGYITGYTDPSKFMKDNLIVFPTYDTCIGIEKNALKGLENEIYEIYIPKNISYIAHGSFDYLTDLIYIEAALGNSEYYSESGVLYYKNGEVAACPELLKTE